MTQKDFDETQSTETTIERHKEMEKYQKTTTRRHKLLQGSTKIEQNKKIHTEEAQRDKHDYY